MVLHLRALSQDWQSIKIACQSSAKTETFIHIFCPFTMYPRFLVPFVYFSIPFCLPKYLSPNHIRWSSGVEDHSEIVSSLLIKSCLFSLHIPPLSVSLICAHCLLPYISRVSGGLEADQSISPVQPHLISRYSF